MDTTHPDPFDTRYRLVPEADAAQVLVPELRASRRTAHRLTRRSLLVSLAAFGVGVEAGFLYRDRAGGPQPVPQQAAQAPTAGLPEPTPTPQPTLPLTYAAPVQFGQIGPQLLKTGTIDYDTLAAAYQQAGQPLTPAQRDILREGSDAPVVFDPDSAYFLLNFFWALGLTNRNPVLLEGPLPQYAGEAIDRFASTGGWTAGTQPVTALYASQTLVALTAAQQSRVEEAAAAVFRPCCDNPTLFPDCNHGMAMLGLLELVAANDAATDDLFDVAKHANAFWFPQQMAETAAYFRHTQGTGFAETGAKVVVAQDVFSATGFRRVHQWLADNGRLPGSPESGGGCSL